MPEMIKKLLRGRTLVSGAVITLVTSFDVWKHTNHNIELHGTEGSLRVPDPNNFGGEVKL